MEKIIALVCMFTSFVNENLFTYIIIMVKYIIVEMKNTKLFPFGGFQSLQNVIISNRM